jgi:O-antigen ligase
VKRGPSDRVLAVALAAFFIVVQFYTSLALLSPTPPVGFVFASPALAVGMVAVLAASALVALWGLLARSPNRLARASGLGSSFAILAAWIGPALLSSLLGLDPRAGLEVVGVMLLGACFHLALRRFYGIPIVAATVVVAYLVTGALAAALGLGMLAARRPPLLYALNHGRAAGVFVTANQFGAFLILFVFVALGASLAARSAALRRLGLVSAGLATAALVATVSQGAWIGAVAGAVFLCATVGLRRLAVLSLIVLIVGGSALVMLRPAAQHNPADAFDRLRTVSAGLRVVELFPLTGVGPMAYWRVYPEIRPPNGGQPGSFSALHPHNVYVSLAGETGLIGFAGLLYGWWRFSSAVRRSLERAAPQTRRITLAICAGLLATLVQGMFDTIGIVEITFVWIPYTALALSAAEFGLPYDRPAGAP